MRPTGGASLGPVLAGNGRVVLGTPSVNFQSTTRVPAGGPRSSLIAKRTMLERLGEATMRDPQAMAFWFADDYY